MMMESKRSIVADAAILSRLFYQLRQAIKGEAKAQRAALGRGETFGAHRFVHFTI